MARTVNADVVLASLRSALATPRERGARLPLEVSILRRRIAMLIERIEAQATGEEDFDEG